MDKFVTLIWFMLINIGVLGFIFIFTVFDSIIESSMIKESCKDIGMEYHSAMDTKFCVDVLGNAHYVKFKCEGFLWDKECTAQIISIGDVRVR